MCNSGPWPLSLLTVLLTPAPPLGGLLCPPPGLHPPGSSTFNSEPVLLLRFGASSRCLHAWVCSHMCAEGLQVSPAGLPEGTQKAQDTLTAV